MVLDRQCRRVGGGRFAHTALSGLLVLGPLLAGCHKPIEGDNIDLPYERPGRFLPEAAEAEARAAQRDVERQEKLEQERDRLAAASGHPRVKPSPPKPEERYEVVNPDSGGTAGPMRLKDGHTVIPQTQAIYGKPPSALNTTDPGASSVKGAAHRDSGSTTPDSDD
jgi:hypothetical protein